MTYGLPKDRPPAAPANEMGEQSPPIRVVTLTETAKFATICSPVSTFSVVIEPFQTTF